MTDTLWAPWRMSYIEGPSADGCVFCEACAAPPESRRDHLVLCRRDGAFAIMNRFPYTHGHLMVVPNRHVSRLDDLSSDERRDFFDLLVDSQRTLREALEPQGINLGMNLGRAAGAGIEDHIHVHIVPRWVGDTNYMPLLADTRVMPQHLEDTYRAILPRFEEIGGDDD